MPHFKDKDEKLKELGKRIKSFRKLKDLTLNELGDKIGMDKQSVHRIEVGNHNPSYLLLSAIAEGLEISICELLKD